MTLPELRRALAGLGRPAALLVLRVPEFERIAWRKGKTVAHRAERIATRSFLRSADAVLRAGDRVAHDAGSDLFLIALTAPSRSSSEPCVPDYRAVTERVAAALAAETGMRVETGWTVLRPSAGPPELGREIDVALERGARERERYEFFAVVGHELRTPLSAIRGYLETLLDNGVDAETSRRFLQTAQRETLRMARLIDGMFEFSLLDLSVVAAPGAGCDLAECIARACEIVRPSAEARHVILSPSTSSGQALSKDDNVRQLSVAVDPDACLQLLVNLLDNAIKFGRLGGNVRIETAAEGRFVRVSVDDDGPGIHATESEAIFALRARGECGGSRPGTGIGLAIVKMIAERSGGTVRACASSLGGARIEVILPARELSAAAS